MNSEVIKNAIGTLDKLLNRAKRAIWEIERDLYGDPGYGEAGGYADPNAAMGASLEEIHDVLLVVLEAAAMPETRTSLLKKWPDFTKNGGLSRTIHNDEFEFCESAQALRRRMARRRATTILICGGANS